MCSNSAKICVAAVASALLGPSSLGVVAFHPSSPPCTLHRQRQQTVVPNSNRNHRPKTRLNISPFGGTGWDNDDFLSSLAGGGPDDDTEGSTELTRSMEAAQRQLQVQERQMQQAGGGDAAALAAATAALGRDQSVAPGGYGTGYAAQPQSHPQVQQGMEEGGGGAQVQKQEVGALPLGWSAHFDPDSRQLYYYNVNDGTTQWDRPASPPPPPLPPGASGGGGDSATFGAGQQQSTASLPAEEARAADEAPVDETVAGAVLTPDMKAKIMASHTEDEEQSGGGHKFRDLMERAKAAAARGQPQQQQQQRMQQQQQPQSVQLPPEAADLPLDVQARMYSELQWRQSNPQVANYATPQYQMNGIGIDGRKVGRNRDSDMISNDSDVYMARLKRDSTTRNLARYAGDDARANDVFHDEEGLAAIQGPEENPYLKERRVRERDMVETVPEEMLLFQEYDEEQQQDGQQQQQSVNYRDRLRQIQEERRSSQ